MDIQISQAGFAGLLGSVAALVLGWAANRYVIPFLQVGRRQKLATLIVTLADEITDELRQTYPEREWLDHLDEAIDRLIEILGIDGEIAARAIKASVARKTQTATAS